MPRILRSFSLRPALSCLAVLALGSLFSSALLPSARAECVDWGAYIHIQGALALDDGASGLAIQGNLAYRVNVNFSVIDISDPAAPTLLGILPGIYGWGVAVRDNYAYVMCDAEAVLKVVDVSEPASPVIVASLPTPGQGWNVALDGDYAYLADDLAGLDVVDISDPLHPRIVANLPLPDAAMDLVIRGEYAYVTDYYDLCAVRITDPLAPELMGFVRMPSAPCLGLDVAGSYAYVGDVASGLKVVDISNPEDLRIVATAPVSSFATAVSVAGDRAYVADLYFGAVLFDISDPLHPRSMGFSPSPHTWKVVPSGSSVFLTHGRGFCSIDVSNPSTVPSLGLLDTSGYARGAALTGSTLCLADGPAGLKTISIADPLHPVLVGSLDTPGDARRIAPASPYALIADDTAGLQVADLSDPGAPFLAGGVDTPGQALDVAWAAPYAFVADGHQGLQVVDVSIPATPHIVGRVDTDRALGVAVTGAKVFVADDGRLRVFDVSTPEAPVPVSELAIDANGIAIAGSHAYVGGATLSILDISDPSAPFVVGRTAWGGGLEYESCHILLKGGYAYLSGGDRTTVIDVSDPAHPFPVGELGEYEGAWSGASNGSFLFSAAGNQGLRVLPLQCDPSSAPPPAADGIADGMTAVPSPARGAVTIHYIQRSSGPAGIRIVGADGRVVRRLFDGVLAAGGHAFVWNGKDEEGRPVPAGVYFGSGSEEGGAREVRITLLR